MVLTKEQIDKYVSIGGISCPFCKSTELSCCGTTTDIGVVHTIVRCDTCHEEWTDIFQLTGIQQN